MPLTRNTDVHSRTWPVAVLVVAVAAVAVAAMMVGPVAAEVQDDAERWEVGDWTFTTASLGGRVGDAFTGAAIQRDGTIVLVGRISAGPLVQRARTLARGDAVVLLLSEDGRNVRAAALIGDDVRDVALDGQDNIYVALGRNGVARLDRQARRVVWHHELDGLCARLDASPNGIIAALCYDNDDDSTPGAGRIHLFNAAGRKGGDFRGYRHTLDVAVDADSRTIVHTGWRQDNAFDGNRTFPVQIAYMRGVGFNGEVKYLLYDWSTDRDDPRFLNRPTNNMADTRGYRMARGRDGKVYAGFEAAGGNHIFRWEPRLEDGDWVRADGKRHQGDHFFEWHNSRAEHKAFFGRYDPATGEYVRGQQFAGRLDSGRTNAVRMVGGALAADEQGRLLAGGSAASGLPLEFTPPDSGDYTGGAYVLLLSPQMDDRPVMTRLDPGGRTKAADIRNVNGTSRIIVAGRIGGDSGEEPAFTPHRAIQDRGEGGSAFFAVLHENAD